MVKYLSEKTDRTAAVVQTGDVRSLSVLGVQVEVLLTGRETGGAYSLYRMVAEPGPDGGRAGGGSASASAPLG